MNLAYATEKFNAAVHSIITVPETLTEQAKLEMAAFDTHTLTANDLPSELSSTFQKWRDDLTRVPGTGGEGSFRATINTMTKDDIYNHLRTFHDLYWRVTEAYNNEKSS